MATRVNVGASVALPVFHVTDADGATVELADLLTGTLTLLDLGTYAPGSPATGILNHRDSQDILGLVGGSPAGAHGVTYDADGVHCTLEPDDNVIVTPIRQVERHKAVFQFTFQGGAFTKDYEIEVVNLRGAV